MSDVFRREYKPLTDEQKSWIASLKEDAEDVHNSFELCSQGLPESDKRMWALAKTNLEQVIMWAIKAIT